MNIQFILVAVLFVWSTDLK